MKKPSTQKKRLHEMGKPTDSYDNKENFNKKIGKNEK